MKQKLDTDGASHVRQWFWWSVERQQINDMTLQSTTGNWFSNFNMTEEMWLMTFKKIDGKLLQNNFLVLCVNHIHIPVCHFKQTSSDFSDESLNNISFTY